MPKRTQQESKGKGGRPKGKPLSAKERAQRRAAAVKTGQYATTALGQALPPCKPAVCPNDGTGTCDVKRAVEARGAGLSACLVSLGHHDVMQKYLAAIQAGDLNGLAELAATSMAGQLALAHDELAVLMREGLVVQVPVVGRNAEGELRDRRRAPRRKSPCSKHLPAPAAARPHRRRSSDHPESERRARKRPRPRPGGTCCMGEPDAARTRRRGGRLRCIASSCSTPRCPS